MNWQGTKLDDTILDEEGKPWKIIDDRPYRVVRLRRCYTERLVVIDDDGSTITDRELP